MKKIAILFAIINVTLFVSNAQMTNEQKMYKFIYDQISRDSLPKNTYVVKSMNMRVITSGDKSSIKSAMQRFTYVGGNTFRIYFLGISPDSINNAVFLKLYKLSEIASLNMSGKIKSESINNKKDKNLFGLPSDISLRLIKEAEDNVHDTIISCMEYENNKVSEFILQLSLLNDNPCQAVSVYCVYKTK